MNNESIHSSASFFLSFFLSIDVHMSKIMIILCKQKQYEVTKSV